jgi:lipoic acid synthetase
MLRNSIKTNHHQLQQICSKHTVATKFAPALDKIRERLEDGPNFQDFIQNPKHSREEMAKEFDGKLKREKGDKERLRLPPWLKTQIPIGN